MLVQSEENLLTLNDAAAYIARRLGRSRRPDHSTVFRWVTRGIGGVRLEAEKLGRQFFTSTEAIDRFAERLAERAREQAESPAPRRRRTRLDPQTRSARRHAEAERRLEEAGA